MPDVLSSFYAVFYSPFLLDMGVIVDMLDTVAIESVASAAITKFQLGVLGVGAATDGAFVAVGAFPVLTAVTAGPIGGGTGVGTGPL